MEGVGGLGLMVGWRGFRRLAVGVEDGLRLPRMSGRKSSKPAPHFNARLPVSNTVKEGTKPRRQSQSWSTVLRRRLGQAASC